MKAFFDISEIRKAPELVAIEIKEKVKAQTGLSSSIDIASNKLLAKIASGPGKTGWTHDTDR